MGIDENGLGPLLGPLLVTAVSAQGPEGQSVPPLGLVGDSKLLVRFGDSALGEAWARVLLRRLGVVPASPSDLLETLLGTSGARSRQLCPSGHAPQCWSDTHAWDAPDEALRKVEQSLDAFEALGWRLSRARSEHVCTRELNDREGLGQSRLLVNLGRMELLIEDARAHAPEGVLRVTCGKVGGMRYYVPQLTMLQVAQTHTEEAAGSSYTLRDGAALEFLRDAESQRPLVALASLIGKYVRDRMMRRICAFHGATDDQAVSGYHDPRTLRFVTATLSARRAARFEESCFLRFGKKGSPPEGVTPLPHA